MFTNITNMQYEFKVSIPYGELRSTLDWCFRNCGDIGIQWNYKDDSNLSSTNWTSAILYGTHNLDYVFSFESEKDFLAFTLTYG